ncbi:zinc-dependent metalloprotease family protein [Arthrobacter luteolus]|uniref:zinc-dependent metalloprotease family protein n=1 Tax=Arthrobacter luteolus TaxID=98672 RepID=UPI00384F8BF1
MPTQDATEPALPEATDPAHVQAPSEVASPAPEPVPAAEMAEQAETAETEDDGYVYVPVGEGHVVPGPDTPLVTEKDGSIRSAVESEHEHVEPMLARGGAASMLAAPARAGNIKVTLVRATVNGNGNLVNLPAARNSITSANNYWRSMSNGRLSMSIASERVHYSSTANASDDYATMMNKIAKELKWVDKPYTALVVFVPTADLRSGGYGGILGGGWTVGGTAGRILMPAPSSFTNNVVTHEVGHVLGLLHANSLQCTNGRQDVGSGNGGRWADGACTSREYGDTTDLMGSAQYNQPVINSYFWDAGNFGRGNEIVDAGRAGTPRTYTLRPWGGTAANRAVKFTDPQSGDTYYIELRQPAGYDQYLQSGPSGNRGVKIVKADKANSWAVNSLIIPPSTKPFAGYYNGRHAWQTGQTFTTHAGTTVRINSVSASSASVTISSWLADASSPISAARAAHPQLGNASSEITPIPSPKGAYRNFQNGAVLWSQATGAKASPNGPIRDAYRRAGFEGGHLGYPSSDQVTLPNGGMYQNFQGGAILWSKATGAQISKNGPIRQAYQRSGFENGSLGFPTSGEVNIPGGMYQNFQGGAILWSKATGAQISKNGPIRQAYQRSGFENGSLGFPTSGEVNIPGGMYQNFQGGAILWSKATGAQISKNGPIRQAYQRSGFENGSLGFPTSGEVNIPGGMYQNFQGGAILWSKATGAQISKNGPIRQAYQRSGFENGSLGFPTSGEVNIPGGMYQNFQGGAILWSKATGAQISKNGPIRQAYQRSGFENGSLGFPTSGEVNIPGGMYQNFQGGAILWSKATGAQISKNGPIRQAYQRSGFENGSLGFPTSGEVNIPGGMYQNFQGGAILWSKATGAQISKNGPIRQAYQRSGFENGSLGFPTSGEVVSGSSRIQRFEGGQIRADSAGRTFITYK